MAKVPYNPEDFLPANASEEEQNIYQGTDNFVGATATQTLRDLNLDVAQTQNVLDAIQAKQPAPVTVDQSDTSAFQPAFSQMTPEQLGLTQTSPALLDAIQQPAAPEDPYSNLSKTQRRMLAFAALSDAGMALQGKQGSSFSNLMSDFTLRADQARKAKAAQMRQEMLGNILSGSAGGSLNRQAIINAMAMGVIDGPTGTAMLSEIERQQGVSQEIAGKEMMIGQIDALLFDPALGKALGIEGFLRTPFAELGLDTDTARVKARIDQIKGGAFLQAFESLKGGGQITELEGQKAEAAQSRLNTAQSEDDFKEALMEYKFYIEQGIRRLNGEQIPPDTLYNAGKSDPLGIR